MGDIPREDAVRTLARVISGLDADLLRGLTGEQGALLDDAAESALRALLSVLMSREVNASRLQLHVVVPSDHAQVVPRLKDLIARELPEGRSIAVVPLEVGDDLGGDIGEHADVFAPGVTEGGGEYRTPVFVNGTAGSPDVRRSLAAVADAWGVATLLTADGAVYVRRGLGDMTSSRMLDALRFTLTKAEVSKGNDVEVLSRGFEGLVRRQGTAYTATRTLDSLLREERFVGLTDHYSACADLLRRHNEEALADELRRLIDHWVRHRIWSVNYVHEMVLHDETHSVGVDRNVASLCETLLAAEKPSITTWDVFVLALCAWLHDWGHASARVTRVPTDPVEVRNYHGYLTALRLAQQPGQHGITDAIIPEGERRKDEHQLQDEVGLLCSHHQGWTSCGDSRPADGFKPLPNFTVLGGGRGFSKNNRDALGLHHSFDVDYGIRLPNGATRGRGLEHMQRLLALLRIADASDVGAHRVPDYATQHANREANHDAFLSQLERNLSLRSSIATLASDIEGANSNEDAAFQGVKDAYKELMVRSQSKSVWADGEFEKKVAELTADPSLAYWDQDAEPNEGPGFQLVRWAWRYSVHVANQVAYYQHHHRVRAVIPVLRSAGGADNYELTLHVVPTERGALGDKATPEAVSQRVAKDVLREYGAEMLDDGTVRLSRQEKHKAELQGILWSLHVNPEVLHPEPYVPRETTVRQVSIPPLGPRHQVPVAVSRPNAVSAVVWTAWRGSGLVSAPLSSITAGTPRLGSARPLAVSGDGTQAASFVDGKVELRDLRFQGQRLTEPRTPDSPDFGTSDAEVLALRREVTAVYVLLRVKDEVLCVRFPVRGGEAAVDDEPTAALSAVRGVFVFDDPHLLDEDGLVRGRHGASLTGDTPLRALDVIEVVGRAVWALVTADDPTEVRVLSARRALRLDPRDERVFEGDEVVTDVAWVREERRGVARLVVVRGGSPTVHDVEIHP